MADVLTPIQRSFNMSRIRGKDTKPEMLLRRGLHARGLRFRLHRKDLPGRPDIVLARYRAAIFVHGCFWHNHGCPLCTVPTTRAEFWIQKLQANRERDRIALATLADAGWRVLTIWECATRGEGKIPLPVLLDTVEGWVASGEVQTEISGQPKLK